MLTVFKNLCLFGEITDIEVTNGKITSIGKTDKDGIDLNGDDVFAGLIDIHCHGCMGYDTMDGDYLDEMSVYLAKCGITSWYPTTVTADDKSISSTVNVKIQKNNGANILGFHLEGPYISKKYKGAQNEKFIQTPNISEFSKYKNIKIVTLAPELCGSMDFIKECNCVVSIGHTEADFDITLNAIDNGAKCLTHTFNAMTPFSHRNPGPLGAAIDRQIYVQVISDGIHLHPATVRMLYRLFGKDKIVLISDCMRATGMPDGKYDLGGQIMTVESGIAKTHDGKLAGSTSDLFTCVKKAIEFGIPREDAFYMASKTPSKLMGIEKGEIKVGADADFIVVNKENTLKMTVIGGRIIK